MYNIVEAINDNLMREPVLKSIDKKPSQGYYLSPSSAMCYSKEDGSAIGSCIKKVWLDKKGYPRSRPITIYNQYQFQTGLLWEDWLIKQYKEIGIYRDNNVKLIDNDLKLSGELDLLHINPTNNNLEFTECKTYNGSNYQVAKELLGSDIAIPKPKDQHLLQVVSYLMVVRRYNINVGNLLYIDKSQSKVYNHKQFKIYLEGTKIKYDTLFRSVLVTQEEDRFDTESLKEKNEACIKLLDLDYIPEPDYKIQYNMEEFEQAYKRGEVSKYKYESVLKGNAYLEDQGHWQCAYCPYGKDPVTGESTCLNTVN